MRIELGFQLSSLSRALVYLTSDLCKLSEARQYGALDTRLQSLRQRLPNAVHDEVALGELINEIPTQDGVTNKDSIEPNAADNRRETAPQPER